MIKSTIHYEKPISAPINAGEKIAEIKFFKKLRIKLIFINNVILCIANPFANSLSQNKQAIDYCLNYILVWLKIFINVYILT